MVNLDEWMEVYICASPANFDRVRFFFRSCLLQVRFLLGFGASFLTLSLILFFCAEASTGTVGQDGMSYLYSTPYLLPPSMAPIAFDPFSSLSSESPNHVLTPRQSTNDDSGCNCPSTISGGAIAGIVIGSIAGTLLLIWLWRTCMTTTALHEAEKTGAPVYTTRDGYPANEATTHHRRRRRRVSPYSEKGYGRRSSVGRGGDVRRPRRVYLA
ncbi:uncharacterized protein BDV17DRAFT_39708 [Aspergillus undulatus]|uniref:uncharacterized protein n=1 Tax=Aspergillus undulatus TaxID=1810928 RepID=UPI003CCDC9EB